MLILVKNFKLGNMLSSRRWAGYAAHVGGLRKGCKILLGKPEGWRLLERVMCIWFLQKQDMRI
jgi:hypothetical protein